MAISEMKGQGWRAIPKVHSEKMQCGQVRRGTEQSRPTTPNNSTLISTISTSGFTLYDSKF